jgi:glyoxylase-like metal-dependent hydrolase (beta-lactamase superfamily II)
MSRAFVALITLLATLISLSPAWAQSGHRALLEQAVQAQGGVAALRALKALSIKAEAAHWDTGQSLVPGGEPRFLGNSTIAMDWDLVTGQARIEWDREKKYPSIERVKYIEVVTPNLGFVVNDKGVAQPMSRIRIAAALRELQRIDPTLLLRMLEAKKGVRPLANELLGKTPMLAIGYASGPSNFTVLIDPKTKLPAAVRTRDDDSVAGDSTFDVVFGDWKPIGGVKIAHVLSYRWNGVEIGKVTYQQVAANPELAPDVFAVPEAIQATAKPPATADVPYWWVIKRVLLGRFADTDTIIFPAGGGLKLVELAPNVQHVQGGGANNLIVAMKDHLVIFDAPYGELQSRWVIDAAKAKYPGKPVRYLVLSHHHMDHSGGVRTFIAEGATVIVPSPGKAYFESVARARHSIVPDELQKKPRAAKIEEVADQRVLTDGTDEIRLYNVENSHAKGMILAHLPGPNIVYVTDILSPRPPIDRNAGTIAVGNAFKKYGISGATIAGGHGTTVKQADIAAALGLEPGGK